MTFAFRRPSLRRTPAASSLPAALIALLAAAHAAWAEPGAGVARKAPSFAEFQRRAESGERLNVVFFGASLTWGANASDPLLTSYRAEVARRLEAKFPQGRFHFWDAAIGGTSSQLGIFRLERDVLRRNPDLVFVDFTANDDIHSDKPETLASYEAIVRRLVVDARCPVVQVLFPFRWNTASGTTDGMKRRDAHRAISQAYHTALGDAVSLSIDRVKQGKTTLDLLWPLDGVHPCDQGYQLFADAAWDGLTEALAERRTCQAPEKMLHSDAYLSTARVRIASLREPPSGWKVQPPNVTAAYFDFTMSRWLDEVCVASNRRPKAESSEKDGPAVGAPRPKPERLRFTVEARDVLLFGESTVKSCPYRVYLDGQPVLHTPHGSKQPVDLFDPGAFARRLNGGGHHVQVVVENLDVNRPHLLEIEAVFSDDADQELRLESVCVAGGAAKVERADAVKTE